MNTSYDLQNYGRSYHPKNWFYNPYYLINRIYYICGGTAYYQHSIRLKPGYAYLFPASSKFVVSQDEEDPIDHVYFDFFSSHQLCTDSFIEIDLSSRPSLAHLFSAAEEDFKNRNLCERTAANYFHLITIELEDLMSTTQYHSSVTQNAIEYIHSAEVNTLAVDMIAQAININVSHFIRCFKKDTGLTPHQYIARYKADIATSLLREGESIQSISDRLGFSCVSAFSSFYKKIRGIAPSEVK